MVTSNVVAHKYPRMEIAAHYCTHCWADYIDCIDCIADLLFLLRQQKEGRGQVRMQGMNEVSEWVSMNQYEWLAAL